MVIVSNFYIIQLAIRGTPHRTFSLLGFPISSPSLFATIMSNADEFKICLHNCHQVDPKKRRIAKIMEGIEIFVM